MEKNYKVQKYNHQHNSYKEFQMRFLRFPVIIPEAVNMMRYFIHKFVKLQEEICMCK